MNILTINHTNLDGVSEALNVVMADEAIELEKENKNLLDAYTKLADEIMWLREKNTQLLGAILKLGCPLQKVKLEEK